MKVTVERASDSEAILNVELEWPEVEKASERAYRRLAQRYNVPGFRPGHAPRSLLERMLGRETIYQDGLETLIDESYREAIRTNDLRPVGDPTLDAAPFEMNEPFKYTAKVPVLAPVKLGDYKNVQVERPNVEITEDDIQKVLRDLQEQQALWIPVERPAQLGDKVIADLKLTIGERTISDLTENEFELAEERQGIFSGMDQHIVGMSEGETKEFTTTTPADYGNAELAGQEAHYVVTLKGVKYHELPELDDEFAKSAGDYESLEGLRTAIREQLAARRESNAQRDFRENLLKAITDSSEVEIHHALVHQEADVMVREMQRMLEQSGLSWDQFLAASGKTEDEYHEQVEPEAQDRVKRKLVLDAIARAEGITTNDAEMEQYLQLLNAVSSTGKPLRLRQLSPTQRQYITENILRDKVVTVLLERAGGSQLAGEASEAGAAGEAREEETAAANAAQAAQVGAQLSEDQEDEAAAREPAPMGEGEITAAGEPAGSAAASTPPAASAATPPNPAANPADEVAETTRTNATNATNETKEGAGAAPGMNG